LCVLNNTSPTYIHPATGLSSAIDLSICSLDIFLDIQWKTLEDLCGRDHYPISISYGSTETSSAIPSWKLRKADWPSFSPDAREQLRIRLPKPLFLTTMANILQWNLWPAGQERGTRYAFILYSSLHYLSSRKTK